MIEKINKELLSSCGVGIAEGKKCRDNILKENSALNDFTGKYIQQQILHACTDFAIAKHLSSIPNIRIIEERNSRNYSFLQIETDQFIMTTSYVGQCAIVPRHAHFRCSRAMSNQPFLFKEQEEQRHIGKPYLILVHGLIEERREGEIVYEKLFGGIGMPRGDAPTRWNEFFFLTDYIVSTKNIPEETIDELDPGFLKLKKNFMGYVDNNDSA